MPMITLRQLLDHAAEHDYAVPAFNINNMEQGLSVMQAAQATRSPVILQASRGARAYANDAVLAGLSPEEFARQVLAEGLGVRHVTVGADFCFGRNRAGNAQMLSELGRALGFGVTVAPLIGDGQNEYSSTAIRTALAEGRMRDAERMLGHWHRIDGEVIHGDKRGRELGYPTANMAVGGLHLPRLGVYAVLVDVLTGPERGSYKAVASLGVRPMFGRNQPNLESFIFDFRASLYGEHLSVALVEYLRPEQKFAGLPELIAQMDRDSAQAREILSSR